MKLIQYKVAKMVESKQDVTDNINPNYDFVDIVDQSIHNDITSIESINTFGPLTKRDFITLVAEIKALLISKGGFINLTTAEKLVVAKLAICTEAEALSVGISSETFEEYIDNLASKNKKAREKRVEVARKDFSRELKRGTMTYAQSNALLVDTRDLFNDYIIGNNPAFVSFITSTNEYLTTGFSTKTYYTLERKQRLIDRIVNGIL